jgi:hypothetical protein
MLYRSAETCSIKVFWLLSQPLTHIQFNLFIISETFAMLLDPAVNRFTQQTLPTIKRKHLFMHILCIVSFCLKKMNNRTLLFGSILLKHSCHFNYWNQLLNMPVCYLDCHEVGLCCCLMIQKTYYIHYSCFTSICDLFADSPSYSSDFLGINITIYLKRLLSYKHTAKAFTHIKIYIYIHIIGIMFL